MSGTTGNIETASQLLNEERDGQAAGSITPKNIRNIILTEISRSFLSVEQYGAVGDGVTDDTAAINSAIQAAITNGGGVVLFSSPSYGISGSGIQLNTSGIRVQLLGYNSTLNAVANSTTVLTVRNANSLVGCSVCGFTINGQTYTGVTGLLIKDNINGVFREMYIKNCAGGVQFLNATTNMWCEGNSLYDSMIDGCTTGIDFQITSGTNSFNQCSLINVGVRNSGIGVHIETGANMGRTLFENLTIWPSNNQTAMQIDAVYLDSVRWNIGMESQSSTNITGLSLTGALTGDQTKSDIRLTFAGTFTTKVANSGNADLVYRDGTNVYRTTANIIHYNIQQSTEAYPRMRLHSSASGTIDFGSGTNTTYYSLQCAYGTSNLSWPGKFLAAGGIGVGNSATATTSVGTLTKKIQVFDASGSSLGYIPVYSTIT